MEQSSAVIGSGIGGIASAIRLAVKGYKVSVFEQSHAPGGKLSQLRLGGFRFDTGPSLFTLPQLVDELFLLCGEEPREHFRYAALDTSCIYFWEDGTRIRAWKDTEAFSKEVEERTGVPEEKLRGHLDKSRELYRITADVFLFNSFHKPSRLLRPPAWKALTGLHRLDALTTMHRRNQKRFGHPKVVQLFDRYATYNGSNPYRTPATLNVIAHLEHNMGAWFPEKGMYSIVESLVALARRQGVAFIFNSPVEEVVLRHGRVAGLREGGRFHPFDRVVSDIDIVRLYRDLLPGTVLPKKQTRGERSTSALIFYWGVDRDFRELGLHNILFSNDYEREFRHLFETKTLPDDPTVYVFISSRQVPGDAPAGCSNWYVMINAPENVGQDWDGLIDRTRTDILEKIRRCLNIDLGPHIVQEAVADPRTIERDTGSYRGSLYGLSSNDRFAAFNRHANFSRKFKNLYFAGGSVHPGGGIPLCLASAKIIDQEIPPANHQKPLTNNQ
jgi:phytoene desaturase